MKSKLQGCVACLSTHVCTGQGLSEYQAPGWLSSLCPSRASIPPEGMQVEGDRLVLTPLWRDEASLREYTNEEVSRFLEEDRLSPEAGQGPQS